MGTTIKSPLLVIAALCLFGGSADAGVQGRTFASEPLFGLPVPENRLECTFCLDGRFRIGIPPTGRFIEGSYVEFDYVLLSVVLGVGIAPDGTLVSFAGTSFRSSSISLYVNGGNYSFPLYLLLAPRVPTCSSPAVP